MALDDYVGRLSLEQINEKVDKREVISKFRTFRRHEEIDLTTAASEHEGNTVYFGSKVSLFLIRFYDKAKEQKVDYPWIRVEIVCRNDRADLVAAAIINGEILSEITAGVLKNYLKFVDASDDTNKSRWPVSKWWSGFLGDVEKMRLTIKKEEITIQEKKDHLTKQYAPTLALISKFDGNSDFLDILVRNGGQRLRPRHFAMLNSAAGEKASLEKGQGRGER